MLDIKFIRENQDLIKAAVEKKHISFDLQRLITVDDARRKLLATVEVRRAEQGIANEKIAAAGTAANDEERTKLIEEMRAIKQSAADEEDKLKEATKAWQALMVAVPNIPDMSVPEGKSDKENVEVRTWGEKPNFSFTPKNHLELMADLNMADFERGAKVAGFRGYTLMNDAVLLTQALGSFVLAHFGGKNFTPMIVPSLVKKAPFIGTGYLPQGEEDLYKTQDDDHLSGSAEVATMGYFMDEVLDKKSLPRKILSYSPCFRREAGSHGKDTKGLIRVHEFYKYEQVVLCEASHEESVKHHEELTANAEEIMQALGLPYRVVLNCGGDLGLGQVKKYDIEAWVPSENTYRETHSASYFHDFQARRLGIRYRDDDGKLKFVHSLNNTALAIPRILVPLLENNQNEDGSINIPAALQPFMGGKTKIERAV
ncbi:MAG: serine--tRNA ligase [Patescibacteria group bacterium]